MASLIVKTEISKPDGTTKLKAGLSVGAIVAAAIAGGLICLGGIAFAAVDVYFAIQEKTPPHLTHLSIGLAVFVAGIVVAFGHYVINPLYQLTVVLNNTSIPIIGGRAGGRRADDPPLAPGSPPPQFPPPSEEPPNVPFPPPGNGAGGQ